MVEVSVRRARVAELVATAFAPLAAVSWLVPDPAARLPILTADFRILVDHALEHGHVDVAEGAEAAAVWFDRTVPVPEPPDYERRVAAACGGWTDRFHTLDELFEANHPEEPHHHLAFLAVRPERQARWARVRPARSPPRHAGRLRDTGVPRGQQPRQP